MPTQSTSPVSSYGSKDKRLLHVTLVTVLVAISIISSPSQAAWVAEAQSHMGTEISVYLWHEDVDQGEQAAAAVFAEMVRIEAMMSTYIEDSQISDINRRAAEGPVQTGEELFQLILQSHDISVLTHGAFDITYDSVGQHYDFRERLRPDETTLATELPRIDYRLVETDRINRSVYFRQPGVRINLGGIAKGYAVERAIRVLRRRGVRHARVTAGGDTRLLGDRLGRPWMIGIQNPRDDQAVALTIPLENEAISTSGDYERFFLEDDTRYHHIIVPQTGKPAGAVRSATILGPDAVWTDALSTSVFVMGVDQGLRLISTLPDYEGVVSTLR